jgi:hypothetical protein
VVRTFYVRFSSGQFRLGQIISCWFILGEDNKVYFRLGHVSSCFVRLG